MQKKKKTKDKPGPKPDSLIIEDENWENALKKAVQKKKPPEGWPDNNKKKSKQ